MIDIDHESRPPDDLTARARDVIATLRGRVHPECRHERSIDWWAANVADELLAKVEQLRSILRSVEWSDSKLYGLFGTSVPCCPACLGIRPGYEPISPSHHHGHREGCAIAAALGEATTPPAP